jgi:hypothetical protein
LAEEVAIREWFLLHLSGKFFSSFYDPLNKIILEKCPVVGRVQFLDRQLHPLSLMQKGNDISVPIKKIGNQSLVFQIKHIITVNFYYTVQLPFWLIAIPQHLVHIHNNGDFD